MIVIPVVNTKGGVGKTTLATTLAVRAAKDSPRVAVVDCDPQRSAAIWWNARGETENPTVFVNSFASNAVEKLRRDGWDWVFIDAPPAFIDTLKEIMAEGDFAVIPVKASLRDCESTLDAVDLAKAAGLRFVFVLNDVSPGDKKMAAAARAYLATHGTVAETEMAHRVSHVKGATVGKSAAEVDKGKDTAAIAEIEQLWVEIKKASMSAARSRRREREAV